MTPTETEAGAAPAAPTPPLIWLASYPRSGNTMLRTIMFQCFGIRSGSIYPRDVTGVVEKQIGHVEHGPNHQINLTGENYWLIKTHGAPRDTNRAIYVLRNGRDATLSYHRFLRGQTPIRQIIQGMGKIPSWSQHLSAWNPLERPGTLVLRYEEMIADISGTVATIADYLGAEPKLSTLPDRESLADGYWIVSANAEKAKFDEADEAAFERMNGEMMRRYGYR